MSSYKRLIAQTHDIDADSPAQADQIARIRASAVDAMLRRLNMGTAWAPTIADAASGADELMDILEGTHLADEIDDDPERNPRPGYVPIEDTTIPERLLAWRDAAVKQALRDAIPAAAPDDLASIIETAAAAINGERNRLAALHEIRATASRIADGLDLSGLAGREDGITWSCAHHGEAGGDREHCPTCVEMGITSAPAPAASSNADAAGWGEPLPAHAYSDGEAH